MADKKITELTQLGPGQLAQGDIFVVVDDPTGTPITKQVTVADVFGSINYVTSTTYKSVSLVKSIVTANTNANGSSNTVIAGEFIVNALSTSNTTDKQYGIVAKSALSAAVANVVIEHAAAKFVLDVSNAGSLIANTHTAIFYVSNTGVRVANVQSFIGFGDQAANSTTAQTKYLFDIGLNGAANVGASSAGANVTTLLSNTSNGGTVAATHKLRIKVNGTDYWVLLANASASNL